VEVIFQWHGLGSLIAESVLSRDYPVVELSSSWSRSSPFLLNSLGNSSRKDGSGLQHEEHD